MGNEATLQPLIDVLYRDKARVDSLCAQHFRGLTTAVEKQKGVSASSSGDISGSLSIVRASTSSNETSASQCTQTIDPHDQLVVDFMAEREIQVYQKSLAELDRNQILLLRGHLNIRDYYTILNAMPLFVDSAAIAANPATGQQGNHGKKAKKRADIKRDEDNAAKMMAAVLELLPKGLEIELTAINGEVVVGSLKSDCLTESPQDLLRMYGTRLPGLWHVLAIVEPAIADPACAESAASVDLDCTQLRQSTDSIATTIREMFDSSERPFTMSPILIYREV